MAEDLDDHRRVFDDLQSAAAVRAVLHVDIEDSFEQPGPAQTRCFSLGTGVIGRGLGCMLWRSGNDFTAQLRVRRQHSMEADRCKHGPGTSAARRCMNSSGAMTIWVVPSLYALFSCNTTSPARLRLSPR